MMRKSSDLDVEWVVSFAHFLNKTIRTNQCSTLNQVQNPESGGISIPLRPLNNRARPAPTLRIDKPADK